MNHFKKAIIVSGLLALSAVSVAHADTQGSSGPLAGLKINETTSDDYGIARGYVVIHEGGGVTRTYQWGGQACNGRNLSEQNTDILARVMASRAVIVTPYYKTGGGSKLCLVGFRLEDPTVFLY